MRVLLAPDRFSGPLNAVQAARALAAGWREVAAGDALTELPLSDGAAGLLDVVHAAQGGSLLPVRATGPLGEETAAAVLHVPGQAGGTAYIEADHVLGTHLLATAGVSLSSTADNPGGSSRAEAARTGTSAGLAALLATALGTGAGRIVVGLPATAAPHDAGRGLLGALGGLAAARERCAGRDLVLALADDLPLLGLHGAGALLGQDPAVGPALAQELERAAGETAARLEREARELGELEPAPANLLAAGGPASPLEGREGRLAGRPGTGAGGGVAFALRLLGARPLPGPDVVARAVGLAEAVAGADLVLTGAAVFDAPALTTSVVATVARAALDRALPVIVVAEELRTSKREVAPLGISGAYEVRDRSRLRPGIARDLGQGGASPAAAVSGSAALRARAARLARTWSTGGAPAG